MNRPAVSVIIACHDAEAVLTRTLDDLRASVFDDFEVVIVDDASSDGTRRVATEALTAFNRSLLVELDDNVGVAEARNIALTRASGKYLWFIDADDRLPTTALADLHRAAEQHAADVVFARAVETDLSLDRVVDIDGLRTDGVHALSLEDVVSAVVSGEIRGFLWSKLFRRAIVPARPFPAMKSQSDFVGVMTILGEATTFVAIPEVVYDYVRAGASITSKEGAFERLVTCEAALWALADRRGVTVSPRDRAFFTGALTLAPGLDSLMRTGAWEHVDRSMVRAQLRRMSLRDLGALARRRRGAAVKLVLAKSSLPAYSSVYHVSRSARTLMLSGARLVKRRSTS